MATFGQIIFYSMITLIVIFATVIILVLSLAFSTSLITVSSSSTKPIANLGQDELLSCSLHTDTFQDRFHEMSVTWEKSGLNGVVYLYKNGAPDLKTQASQFKGRTQVFPEEVVAGNASLLLRSVRSSDEGEYTCTISSSSGGGKVNIHLRTAAFSTPTFTFSDDTLTARASRWLPKPNVTWANQTGDVLNGSTSFTKNNAGIYRVVSELQPAYFNETYSCSFENNLVIVVAEATITDAGIVKKTYFTFSVASALFASVYLNIITSVLCVCYVA